MYDVAEIAGALLSKPIETGRTLEEGCMAIYESQLKNGLRFPIFDLLKEVINHYRVSILQNYLIGICRMIFFEMACKQVRVNSSIVLFRQFYKMNGMGGMFCFSSRPERKGFLRDKG